MRKVIQKRYCGFKTVSEDGTQYTNLPLQRSNGFKVVKEVVKNDDGESFIPFKKRKTTFAV